MNKKNYFNNKTVIFFPDGSFATLAMYLRNVQKWYELGKSNPYKGNERL